MNYDYKLLIFPINYLAELEKYVPAGATFQECFDKASASIKDDRSKAKKGGKTK